MTSGNGNESRCRGGGRGPRKISRVLRTIGRGGGKF
jgi:hypothetical protein